MMQSDIDRSQGKEERSWIYYRFLQMSDLDPLFYHNYRDGGLYLSVIKDDPLGAKHLFEKGLSIYKEDFWLSYFGAFNDYFELGNKEDALEKYRAVLSSPLASKHSYLYTIIAQLETSTIGHEQSYKTLTSILTQTTNKHVQKKIKYLLYSLKAEKDLNCLNGGKKDCSFHDEDGRPYYRDNQGMYRAYKKWRKFESKTTETSAEQ
ncbi:MAG: hypothetical protein OXB88_05545 [Bacteriovoracales bacterium]|nr:hypothetical protein [Bacteriovoracales bacterium]